MIFFLRSPRACDVGRGNSFQRQPVADTLVDDATQLLCQGNAGIAGGQRREVGNAPGNFSRPMQQTVAGTISLITPSAFASLTPIIC